MLTWITVGCLPFRHNGDADVLIDERRCCQTVLKNMSLFCRGHHYGGTTDIRLQSGLKMTALHVATGHFNLVWAVWRLSENRLMLG